MDGRRTTSAFQPKRASSRGREDPGPAEFVYQAQAGTRAARLNSFVRRQGVTYLGKPSLLSAYGPALLRRQPRCPPFLVTGE